MAGKNFPKTVHGVIMFLVGTIMVHLQVKSQYMQVSPYEEHPAIIWITYISLFTYGMVLIIQFGCQIHNPALGSIVKRFSPVFGALVVVMHMLLLHWGFGWFTFTLWVISLVGSLWCSWPEIEEMYQCIKENIGCCFRRKDEQSNSGVSEVALPPATTAQPDLFLVQNRA